jgi:hypothetical protein
LEEGPYLFGFGIAVAIGGNILLADKIKQVPWVGTVVTAAAALFAVCGVGVLIYRVVTLPRWFRQKAEWRRSWICGRCSNIFLPSGG